MWDSSTHVGIHASGNYFRKILFQKVFVILLKEKLMQLRIATENIKKKKS